MVLTTRLALLLALLSTASALAGDLPRGSLVESVACRSDATQTYTLFLPSSYDAKSTQPALLIFDPRGRGTKAAEIFREAAEEYGWILISSNQTRSDGSSEPNTRAVNALLPELTRYAVNPKRVYATGFSGTAMLAWSVGIATGRLAGVIGVGGRLVEQVPPSKFNFAHYGFAGDRDFNQREMRMVEAVLDDENRIPHRFESFDGDHQWIPPALAREALGWMEVVAGNEKVLSRVFAADLAAADASGGLEALRRYRAVARTYEGRTPLESVRARISSLESDPAVQREIAEEKKGDAFEAEYVNGVFTRIPNLIATMRAQEAPPTAADAARAFRLKDLRRRAAGEGGEAAAARRLLEAVYVQAAFYLREQLFDRHEYPLATALLGMAADIHPERWDVWYNLAAAHALGRAKRPAYSALDRALKAGFHDGQHLATDDDFVSLRGEKRFQDLVILASSSQ